MRFGSKIENFAKEHNLGVFREFVGHGLGTNIHEDPDIPNYYTKDATRLKNGMVIEVKLILTLNKRFFY